MLGSLFSTENVNYLKIIFTRKDTNKQIFHVSLRKIGLRCGFVLWRCIATVKQNYSQSYNFSQTSLHLLLSLRKCALGYRWGFFQWNSEILLKTKRNTRVDSDSRCVPVHSPGSAGGAERHLQQDHLPVLGRVAFVDVPRESR